MPVLACWKRWCLGTVAALVTLGASAGVGAAPKPAPPRPPSLLDSVARHLGVPTGKLEAAVRAAQLERYEAFVSGHDVPEARANEMREKIAHEPVTLTARFGTRGRGIVGAAAAYLGVPPAEVAARLREGKSLADIAQAAGKTAAGLKDAIYGAAQADLDRRVQGGTMTPEARQKALDNLKANLDAMIRHRFRSGAGQVRALGAA